MSDALAHYVHRWIPGSGDVLLLLHGTGGNENDLIPLGAELLPGAAVLSPRGNVMEGPMPRFFRRLREGVFDLEDLALRTRQLADFVRAAAAAYQFELARVVAVGFSNGANIGASVLLTDPAVMPRAVLFRAMVPFEPAAPPRTTANRVYLGGGRMDPLIPAAGTERLAELLRDAGAEVTLDWQPAGHNLTRADIVNAQRWLTA
jgi:predicted esterase